MQQRTQHRWVHQWSNRSPPYWIFSSTRTKKTKVCSRELRSWSAEHCCSATRTKTNQSVSVEYTLFSATTVQNGLHRLRTSSFTRCASTVVQPIEDCVSEFDSSVLWNSLVIHWLALSIGKCWNEVSRSWRLAFQLRPWSLVAFVSVCQLRTPKKCSIR